jgi:tyrosyl-tRNA synthetase
VIDLVVLAQLAPSKGAARRLLDQGGLSVNGRKLSAADRTVRLSETLVGQHLLLKKGARDFALIRANP